MNRNHEPRQVVGKRVDQPLIYLFHIFVYLETGFEISPEEQTESRMRIERPVAPWERMKVVR
jgi:hypothetical protein